MALRGEIFQLRGRMGFGERAESDELVIIVQSNALNDSLPTLLVVPLLPAQQGDDLEPSLIAVSRRESGQRAERFAHTTQLGPVFVDELVPGAVGRLSAKNIERLDDVLARVLDL